jgi:hypothetical protein
LSQSSIFQTCVEVILLAFAGLILGLVNQKGTKWKPLSEKKESDIVFCNGRFKKSMLANFKSIRKSKQLVSQVINQLNDHGNCSLQVVLFLFAYNI